MASELEANGPPFPNNLRNLREIDGLTRAGLKSLCDALGAADPARYRSLSLTTLRDLELGQNKPKTRTANTLAKTLDKSIVELFPLGIENPLKNPLGNTTITPGRNVGGRKKNIKDSENIEKQ